MTRSSDLGGDIIFYLQQLRPWPHGLQAKAAMTKGPTSWQMINQLPLAQHRADKVVCFPTGATGDFFILARQDVEFQKEVNPDSAKKRKVSLTSIEKNRPSRDQSLTS